MQEIALVSVEAVEDRWPWSQEEADVQLRPRVELRLHQQSLQRQDGQRTIASVTAGGTGTSSRRPRRFLGRMLAGAQGEFATKLLLSKLEPRMESWLKDQNNVGVIEQVHTSPVHR